MLFSNEAALFSSLAAAASASSSNNSTIRSNKQNKSGALSSTNTGVGSASSSFWPTSGQLDQQQPSQDTSALNEFILQHFAAAAALNSSSSSSTPSLSLPFTHLNGKNNGGGEISTTTTNGAASNGGLNLVSQLLVGDLLRELLRQSGVDDLKTTLNSFVEHVESNKNSQTELSNQFKSIQKALGSINANSLDKSTTLTLLQAFQNQLNNLSDRIQASEKIALQTAKFFSALFENCCSNNNNNSSNEQPSTTTLISSEKLNGCSLLSEEEKMVKRVPKKKLEEAAKEPIRVKTEAVVGSTKSNAIQQQQVRRRKPIDYNEQGNEENEEEEQRRVQHQQQLLLQQLILHQQQQQQQQQNEYNEDNSMQSMAASSETSYDGSGGGGGGGGTRQGGGRVSNGGGSTSNNEFSNKYPYDVSGADVPDESTEEIARRIKDYITTLKISQRNFAESILNMKQANFSTLLSQPMTWSTLSKTYKDRFMAMYMWLNDIDRMDKLNERPRPQQQQQTVTGRSTSPVVALPPQPPPPQAPVVPAIVGKMATTFDFGQVDERKRRITFTPEQLDVLRTFYRDNAYPIQSELDELADSLGLESRKVSTWFMNQRQVNKRQDLRLRAN